MGDHKHFSNYQNIFWRFYIIKLVSYYYNTTLYNQIVKFSIYDTLTVNYNILKDIGGCIEVIGIHEIWISCLTVDLVIMVATISTIRLFYKFFFYQLSRVITQDIMFKTSPDYVETRTNGKTHWIISSTFIYFLLPILMETIVIFIYTIYSVIIFILIYIYYLWWRCLFFFYNWTLIITCFFSYMSPRW